MLTTETMRTNPAVARQVIADARATNPHAAGKRHGFHNRTVRRWVEKADAEPGWPTDADITAWETADRERGAVRAAKSAQRLEWAKRVYVTRGLMLVDHTGTTRRLRALYAIGWTSTEICRRLDLSPARIGHLVAGKQAKVHRDTAARVAAVYDDLCMIVPHDPAVLGPQQTRVHARQRRQSAAKGWAPPLAWDDIDDPDETPTGWAYAPSTRADRLEELLDDGGGLYEVLRDLHMSRNSFHTWCTRHGHSDTYRQLAAAVNDTSNGHVERRAS